MSAKALGLVAVVCLLVCLVVYIYQQYRDTIRAVEEHYALSEVTEMIICYVHREQGSLPSTWDDLEEAYHFVDSGYNAFSLPELRARVHIDFGALKRLNADDYNGNVLQIVSEEADRPSTVAEREANQRLRSEVRSMIK